MDYSDAIKYLRENEIKKDDGTYYEFGEVCALNLGISFISSCYIYPSLYVCNSDSKYVDFTCIMLYDYMRKSLCTLSCVDLKCA